MSPDKNVEYVRQKMLSRSVIGFKKYGVTTQRTDIDLAGWLNHLQQELMDASIYCQAAMSAHSDIATLEQEIKQVRARLARVDGERDELLAAAEAIEINAEECMDFDDCMAILVPIDDYHKLIEAIYTVKGGAA